MEYITSAERIGMEQGLEKGRQALLALLKSILKGKFGVLAELYQQPKQPTSLKQCFIQLHQRLCPGARRTDLPSCFG